MNKRITYSLLMPVIVALAWAFVPPPPDSCTAEVKQVYKKVNALSLAFLNSDKVCYMKYTVKTATEDSIEDGIHESTLEMIACKKRLTVKSKEMEVYQDEHDAFVVLPGKKMVLRNDPDFGTPKKLKNNSTKVNIIQDTVFHYSTVTSCEKTPQGGKKIVFTVNEKGRELFGVSSLLFEIHPGGEYFDRIRINYDSYSKYLPQNIVYVDYIFQEVSYDYKNKKPQNNVERIFMSGKTQLKPVYMGYTFIDNRVKKDMEK